MRIRADPDLDPKHWFEDTIPWEKIALFGQLEPPSCFRFWKLSIQMLWLLYCWLLWCITGSCTVYSTGARNGIFSLHPHCKYLSAIGEPRTAHANVPIMGGQFFLICGYHSIEFRIIIIFYWIWPNQIKTKSFIPKPNLMMILVANLRMWMSICSFIIQVLNQCYSLTKFLFYLCINKKITNTVMGESQLTQLFSVMFRQKENFGDELFSKKSFYI